MMHAVALDFENLFYKRSLWSEQTIFLVVFNLIYPIQQQEIYNKRKIFIVAGWFATCLFVFFYLQLYFGFKPSPYPASLNIARSTNLHRLLLHIIPLWLSEVTGFVVLCVLSFKHFSTKI